MHCLKDLNIDGIAYMSTKSRSEFEFPLNVNLALPVFDEEKFDKLFKLTKPISLESFINLSSINAEEENISFINNYYKNKKDLLYSPKYFLSSIYSKLDNYLVNQGFDNINK